MSASPQNQTPDSTSGSRKFAPRRSHNKSRLGCGNCKRRRVKCDEEKPGCGNCKKHRVSCDFTSSSTTSTYNTAAATEYQTPPGPDIYISSEAPTPTSDPAESGPSSLQELRADTLSGSSDQIPSDGSITFADLELLHHFCTSACYTLSESLDGHNFWQITVPQIGFSYRFVLHLVLALSAHHLSRSRPEKRESYVAQAEHHHNIGLQQVTSILPHADTQNCAAIYIAGVLVCFYNLAGGPRPGEYLAFTEKGAQGEWLVLIRGVRAIITSMGGRFWAIMTPILNGGIQKVQPVAVKRRYQPVYEKPIQELHQFIESLNNMPRNLITLTNLQTLESLLQTFKTVYNSHEYYTHTIFAWMYCLSDDYIASLQALEPTALLIFAYYTVLMRELDTFWFLDGWVKHVMNGILKVLPESYHLYLQWPLREIDSKSGGIVEE